MKTNFLFDLNGTMINDMDYHITAWFDVFNSKGAVISWERMKEECYGKNEEIVERIYPGRFNDAETREMSLEKERRYQQSYQPFIQLLPGLGQFLEDAHSRSIGIAIGSAAVMSNIDFIIDNLNIRKYFDSLVSADDVLLSKPDPETYLTCASQLNVSPSACIVFEDSPKGVEAASRAGMKAVAITTLHSKEEFQGFSNILMIVEDYTDPALKVLLGS